MYKLITTNKWIFRTLGDFKYQTKNDRTPTVYELLNGTFKYNGSKGYMKDIKDLLFDGSWPHR